MGDINTYLPTLTLQEHHPKPLLEIDMAVYVDNNDMLWKGKMWCHLTADSLDELHAFAAKLGLKREWYQYPKSAYPHYDTVFREKAIRLGAIPVSSKVIVGKARKLRPPNWREERSMFLYCPEKYYLFKLLAIQIDLLEKELDLVRGTIVARWMGERGVSGMNRYRR
jgi:hypothetical protein